MCFFSLLSFSTFSQEIFSTEKLPEVVEMGEGSETLLLIPCMSCRWNEWQEFMERNQEKYRMFAITVPGYGGTPFPDLPKNTEKTPWRNYLIEGLSELIDAQEMEKVIVVGHSWGTMVATQLAAVRKDKVKNLIIVDGSMESTTWVKPTVEERLVQANTFIQEWQPKLNNAEEWAKFNGASVGSTLGKTDSVSTERMLVRIKLLTSFMATDRTAMLQYWRENMLIDLTGYLHQIEVPILDIQAFSGKDQKGQKAQHLADLATANAPKNIQNVFMYDTKHFVMYHRPSQLDCLIEDFIKGKPLVDFAPAESEYFEEKMN